MRTEQSVRNRRVESLLPGGTLLTQPAQVVSEMGGSLWEVVGFSTEVKVPLTQKRLEQVQSHCINEMQLFCIFEQFR